MSGPRAWPTAGRAWASGAATISVCSCIIMLRQSVKRPRATAADKLSCSKWDVNKRKHQTTRRTRRPVARVSTPRPCRASPPSSTSGSTGTNGISAPGYTSFCNRSGTWSAHEFRADFIKAPAQDYPQPILADIQSAPGWRGVERFTPGHYPTHGLGFLPKSSDCAAEVARTDSLNLRIFLLVN